MDENILATLRKWKKRQFFDKHVQLAKVGKYIHDGKEPFTMVAISPSRWMCMSKETGLPIVFTYPVLWNSNTDLQAGNYMPADVEKKVNFKVVRELSSWLSKIVYYFDVNLDDGFLTHMKELEDYILNNQNFNLTGRMRKEWQNGSINNGRYQVKHKLFVHAGSKYSEIPDEELNGVHPWLVHAIRKQMGAKRLNLNVPFPSCVDFVERGPATSILDEDPPTFSRGDIVVMNFRLGFILGEKEWWPDILPDEFVRVERANRDDANRYSHSNWPGRDPNVQRLAVSRKINQTDDVSPSLANQVKIQEETEAGETDETMASETDDADDDSLSQHSAESIKRRIGKLAVEEEMVLVDSPVDPDEDMEEVPAKPTRRRFRR